MRIEQSTRDGCVVVTLRGRIDISTVSQVQRVLLKQLNRHPFALICDLSGVESLDPVCATIFSTVANHPSSHWPGTSFLLSSARPAVADVLEGLQVPHFLRLQDTVDHAVREAYAQPPYLRDELRLAPTPSAPGAARRFIREVCGYWGLGVGGGNGTDTAVLLADELVTNAVLHAHTELLLRLELRGTRLHLAVEDGSPRLLRLVASDLEAEGGRGLLLVERVARAWGVRNHPAGGKVVWCILDL
jgi:anti-anti-sigma factor